MWWWFGCYFEIVVDNIRSQLFMKERKCCCILQVHHTILIIRAITLASSRLEQMKYKKGTYYIHSKLLILERQQLHVNQLTRVNERGRESKKKNNRRDTNNKIYKYLCLKF